MYWWMGIKKDIKEYVSKCLQCQQIQAVCQKLIGLLQPLLVSKWKWEDITVNYVIGFPCTTKGNNYIWVIIDHLTKSSHFILIRNTQTMDQMVAIYLRKIVRLHGAPVSITLVRDLRFISRFLAISIMSNGDEAEFELNFSPID